MSNFPRDPRLTVTPWYIILSPNHCSHSPRDLSFVPTCNPEDFTLSLHLVYIVVVVLHPHPFVDY